MPNRIQIQPDASDLTLGIAVSKYHGWSTEKLLQGAQDRFKRLGGDPNLGLVVAPAAGAWELPAVCQALAQNPTIEGVIAIGVVIQGETSHFEYICQGVTQGLTELSNKTGIPIGFGVLTCQNTEEVEARSGGAVGNKGAEALQAVVESALTIRAIESLANQQQHEPHESSGG